MHIKVKLTKNIFDKIADYYIELYNQRFGKYPYDRSYTKKQLQQNIRVAKSIHNTTITESDITQPIYIPWINNGWKEIKANNWHYAIVLMNNAKGNIEAMGQDAHHKNDNLMQTQPYVDESYRRVMNLMERLDNLYKQKSVASYDYTFLLPFWVNNYIVA